MKRTLAVLLGFLLPGAATVPTALAQEEEGGWPREINTSAGRAQASEDRQQLVPFQLVAP